MRIFLSRRRIPWFNQILCSKSHPLSRDNFLGENFFVHDGVFLGRFKFYFLKSLAPHGKIFLVRISLVMTAYSLVNYNFIFRRPPLPHGRISLVRISFVTTVYSLVDLNFIFQRPPPHGVRFSLITMAYSLVG